MAAKDKMKIINSTSVIFSDEKSKGNTGYASGWFFWVNKGFKEALDIGYHEIINSEKTLAMRDSRAVRLGYKSLADFRQHLKSQNVLTRDDEDYSAIVKHAVRDSVEKQNDPPAFSFRVTDGLESRCGRWYISVTDATPDKRLGRGKSQTVTPGSVSFDLLGKTPTGGLRKTSSYTCAQSDLVELLRDGENCQVDLTSALPNLNCPLFEQIPQD